MHFRKREDKAEQLGRVEKLLCSQQALCRCKKLAGWETHTLELLFVPTPEKGMFLGTHPLHMCVTDTSEEVLLQGCGGQHAQWLLPRDVGLTRGDSWVPHNNCLLSTPIHSTGATSDRLDLCRLMSRVKQKQSCCQQQSEPATVCQNMDAGSAACFSCTAPWHTSQEAENQAKTNKQKWDRRKLLYMAYKAISCKMEVSHAVTSRLVQSVKLRAGDSSAI